MNQVWSYKIRINHLYKVPNIGDVYVLGALYPADCLLRFRLNRWIIYAVEWLHNKEFKISLVQVSQM